MTTDDFAYLSSIDPSFLKDLKKIIKTDFNTLTDQSITNLLKCLKKGGEESDKLVAKNLLIMDIEQMGAVLPKAINDDLRGIKRLCEHIRNNDSQINTKLTTKVRTINTQSIVKATLVDTNVLKLRKIIRSHA